MKTGVSVLGAMVAAIGVTAAAQAQTTAPATAGDPSAQQPAAPRMALLPIEPENALEHAFVSALTNAEMRPVFRRQLLESHVALALASDAPDAPPLEVSVRDGLSAGLIFTSVDRLNQILGPQTPRVILTGRAALERLRGKNVVVNARLMPMLTLEPEDVARYLETPVTPTSAGPSQ